MICVDTSVWVAAQCGRDPVIQDELQTQLDAGEVVLPVVVRIELLAGTAPRQQQRLARDLSALPLATPNLQTWRQMEAWIQDAANAGRRFGFADLLIAALAAERDARVWSLDHAFAAMAELGWIRLFRSTPC